VNSLCNTIKLAREKDIDIIPMWVSFDALLQRARNDTIQLALETECDDIIFIDTDIEWQPEWFFKLLEYDVDVVGGTYPKKGYKEEYVIRQLQRKLPNADGLIEVDGLGTGFVRLSNKAMQYLWDTSAKYIDPKDNKERRMIFDVVVQNESLVSEDIHMFNKLTTGGFKVYLDPTMTCNHTGPKKFTGSFENWYNKSLIKNIIKPTKQL
jgi:glycosyltransferase involved in cell wall biosynthesis